MKPGAVQIVRSVVPDQPYWRQVLQYCTAGNLQASLDEFAHVLPEFHGFVPPRSTDPAWDTAKAMRTSMGLRTATIAMHAHQPGASLAETDRIRMRCHLALTLNEHDASGTGDDRTRSAEVRAAFNSPYWPFVLMTTSAGQEGLDFHLYSHAVVHWNLPSNPVDLEQREGRVHRFKGHAVRKNLALVHGALGRSSAPHRDPWAVMFTAAAEERPPDASELEPYWVFAPEGGVRIERHIPTMAWSKDVARTKAMTTALAAYRLAFGQPRQEDLVAYLERTMDQADIVRLVDELKLDLAPPTR